MISTMTLAALLVAPAAAPKPIAAPLPAIAAKPAIGRLPVNVGSAPKVLELKPETDGKVRVTITRMEKQKVKIGIAIGAPGGAAPKQIEREVNVPKEMRVELSDVKDLTVTTASGKAVDTKEAIKKLSEGGLVVVTTDGKALDPKFLKVLREDTLVLVSPELVNQANGMVGWGVGGGGGAIIIDEVMPVPAPPIKRPLPAPLPAEKE